MSSTTQRPDAEQGLKRNALGTSDLVFIVVSAAAPLMIMVGVAPLAFMFGGVGAPSAYVLAGLALALFAVGFMTMSRHVENAGAFYAYIGLGLGRTAGVVSALVALVSYNALQIGVYGLAGVAVQGTFDAVFGIHQPWWVYALACIAIVWYVGFRSVDFGAKFLAVLLTAETGLLLLLAVAVLVQGGTPEGIGLESFAPGNVFTEGMIVILPMAFAAFMGFEATVIYRSETRDPRRTIPRATYLAVAVLAGTYAFIAWSIVQAFGADGVVKAATTHDVGMFFVAGETYLGRWFTTAMHLLIATSVVASLVAFHNAVTRYAVAIAGEGLLPSALTKIHPKTRAPYVAGLAQTVLVAEDRMREARQAQLARRVRNRPTGPLRRGAQRRGRGADSRRSGPHAAAAGFRIEMIGRLGATALSGPTAGKPAFESSAHRARRSRTRGAARHGQLRGRQCPELRTGRAG
jgi:amino acid transporter